VDETLLHPTVIYGSAAARFSHFILAAEVSDSFVVKFVPHHQRARM
jgi:hypothetical protein